MEFLTQLSFSNLSVIGTIFVTETLLSVDNLLIILTLTSHLPQKQKLWARFIGMIILGVGLRILALLFATTIIKHIWILYVGAAYLIWLPIYHFFLKKEKEEGDENEQKKYSSFFVVILTIGFTDLIFSIDNVIVAIGLSTDLVVVATGVIIGMVTMLILSVPASKLIKRYPNLEGTAYAVMGLVGACILLEKTGWAHVEELEKFTVVILMVLCVIVHSEYKLRNA